MSNTYGKLKRVVSRVHTMRVGSSEMSNLTTKLTSQTMSIEGEWQNRDITGLLNSSFWVPQVLCFMMKIIRVQLLGKSVGLHGSRDRDISRFHCIFTDAIPVSLSEDQDWSQLTARLRVGPVSCILQIQGLPQQFLKQTTLVNIFWTTLTWGHGYSCIYCLIRLWSWPRVCLHRDGCARMRSAYPECPDPNLTAHSGQDGGSRR